MVSEAEKESQGQGGYIGGVVSLFLFRHFAADLKIKYLKHKYSIKKRLIYPSKVNKANLLFKQCENSDTFFLYPSWGEESSKTAVGQNREKNLFDLEISPFNLYLIYSSDYCAWLSITNKF